jgi:uncharacterized protein involved in exopolysaccharide biosynthesis
MPEITEKVLKEKIRVEETSEINLMDYLKVLWRWKFLIIGGTILGMVIAAVLSGPSKQPIVYKAGVLLLIADPKPGRTIEGDKLPTMNTYITMIKSRSVAAKAVEKFGLDQPPYQVTPEGLMGMIVAEPVTGTNLLRLVITHTDPEKARDLANAVANAAVEVNRALNEEETIRFRDALKAQLGEIGPVLDKAEQELMAFKEVAEIEKLKKEVEFLLEERKAIYLGVASDTSGTRHGLLSIDRAIEEKNAIADFLAKKLGSEKKVLELSRFGPGTITTTQNKDAIEEEAQREDALIVKEKYEQINSLYDKLEPKLVDTLSDLEGLKVKKEGLIKSLEINEERLADVQKELAQKELKLQSLTRTYELAKGIHTTLAQRFEEARTLIAAKTQELKVVDPAVKPKVPVKQEKNMSPFFGGAIGFFVSLVLLVFLLEFTSPVIKSKRPSIDS